MTQSGIGRIFRKNELLAEGVTYELDSTSATISTSHLRGSGSMQGMTDSSGRLEQPASGIVMGTVDLELEDGGRVEIILEPDGTFEALGAIRPRTDRSG